MSWQQRLSQSRSAVCLCVCVCVSGRGHSRTHHFNQLTCQSDFMMQSCTLKAHKDTALDSISAVSINNWRWKQWLNEEDFFFFFLYCVKITADLNTCKWWNYHWYIDWHLEHQKNIFEKIYQKGWQTNIYFVLKLHSKVNYKHYFDSNMQKSVNG